MGFVRRSVGDRLGPRLGAALLLVLAGFLLPIPRPPFGHPLLLGSAGLLALGAGLLILARFRAKSQRQHRQTEQSLKILQKAVEKLELGLTITDPSGTILYVNPAEAAMHGYRVSELLGASAEIFAAERTRPPTDGPELWTRERIHITRGGRCFPIRLISDHVRDAEGRPVARVTLSEDLTERRSMHAALERSDRIVAAVSDATQHFLGAASWEERLEDVLERLGKAAGVARMSIARWVGTGTAFRIDHSWPPELSPDGGRQKPWKLPPAWHRQLLAGQVVRGHRDALGPTERAILEARGLCTVALAPFFVEGHCDGFLSLEERAQDRRWTSAEIEALLTAAHTLGAAIQRKRDEEALASSEARYRDVLEGAHDLIQSLRPDGRFELVNRAWRRTLGYRDGPDESMRFEDILHRRSQARWRRDLATLQATRQAVSTELVLLSADGREVTVEGSLAGHFDAGRLTAVRMIFRDISVRKDLEHLKREFVSTVSHELRTPLTSILAALGLLRSRHLIDPTGAGQDLLEVAERNGNRLLQLINDLLDLQKLASGRMSFRLEPTEARSLLQEAVRSIEALAEAMQVQLELRASGPQPIWVEADRERLMQVLTNLLSNAIKFSPQGSRVSVWAQRRGERAILAVRDRGEGIPEPFQQRMFEQFSQLDASSTRRSGGSGLGLSIVKSMAEGMGGQVDFDSTAGAGTTFYVLLPLAAAPGRRQGSGA